MTRLIENKAVQIALSLATALYFFLVIAFLRPTTQWSKRLKDEVSWFWNYWRLDQNWALFSPEIRAINYHTTTVITFEDGTRTIWELPRASKLSLASRFKDEKWRKWAVDSLPWDDYKEFWPDLARYVGRKFYCPTNKPMAMALDLWWIDIPPASVNQPQTNLPLHSKYCCVFEYRYSPQDFQ